jgi:hypothetical protein
MAPLSLILAWHERRARKPVVRRFLFLLALALPAVFAATAAADTPTIVEQSLRRSFPNFVDCPGFTVAGEFDVDRTVMTFVDANGTPIRQVTHVHFVGTLTNTSSGKSIPDAGNQVVTADLLTGTQTVDGRVRVDTVPGEGVVLAQVGRTVRDAQGNFLFIAGQQDFANQTLADFCAFMAAP